MIKVNIVIFNYFIKQDLNLSQPISIYIHWPFCKSKCPYCDFNSHVRSEIDTISFINAYLKEIALYLGIIKNRPIKSIFFGGGTPSLAPVEFFEAVLNKLSSIGNFLDNIEITLEANPTSSESGKFKDYASVGINRVSIGIQSFNSEKLKFLGREHSVEEAKKAISYAARYFSRYTFDLIYALPQQTLEMWRKELENAVKFTRGHLSLYQLTIEKGTKFYGEHRKNKFVLPEQEQAADLYELTQEIMEKHYMPAYEISNHAQERNESIHNLNYWEYGDYIGIGAGAHGRYFLDGKKLASINVHLPEQWLNNMNEKGNAHLSVTELDELTQRQEQVMMGIRLSNGINKGIISNSYKLQALLEDGYLEECGENIRASKKGKLVLNTLIKELIS